MTNTTTPVQWIYSATAGKLKEIADLFVLFDNASVDSEIALGAALLSAAVELLESVANSCIHSIPASEELKTAFDKFSLLDKLDLLQFLRTRKPLNRGLHLVGNIKALINIRNPKTHPRPLKAQFTYLGRKEDTIDFKTDKTPYYASKKDTSTSLCQVFEFLDYYLIDQCKCAPIELSTLFNDMCVMSDGMIGSYQNLKLPEAKKLLESRLSISIKFLSYLDKTPEKNSNSEKFAPVAFQISNKPKLKQELGQPC